MMKVLYERAFRMHRFLIITLDETGPLFPSVSFSTHLYYVISRHFTTQTYAIYVYKYEIKSIQ